MSLLLVALVTSLGATRTAHACDPGEYLTRFDLHDRAVTVVLIDVKSVAADGTVKADVVEIFKGSPGKTLTFTDGTGDCAAVAAGVRGVAFIDAAGQALGEYKGFVRDKTVIDALRRYAKGATAAERAAPVLDLAISRDWARSYEGAIALADRANLVVALDAVARDQLVARLVTVSRQHPLIRAAARLHDARVTKSHKRRGFADVGGLASILARKFAAEGDAAKLADVIEASGTTRSDRIAALERCEQVWVRPLLRFMDYTMDFADRATWKSRAAACRTGVASI